MLGELEKIWVKEVVQEEEPECELQETELLGISLHALAGATTPRTVADGKSRRRTYSDPDRHWQYAQLC